MFSTVRNGTLAITAAVSGLFLPVVAVGSILCGASGAAAATTTMGTALAATAPWPCAATAALVDTDNPGSPASGGITGELRISTEADIPAAIEAMTLAEKVGQMVQTDIAVISPQEVREHHIGSIISLIPEGKLGTSEAWRELVDAYQRQALRTRTGIPLVFGIDAVHGHSYFDGNSVILPHNIGLGATRNPDLARKLAQLTARELSATGVRWTFSPTIAVARDIRWGRTYESFGEDVELQRMFATPMIEGYQGVDLTAEHAVAATAKHFIADGATDGGIDRGNATLSGPDLRAMHLPGFIDAINLDVAAVMASFSSLNGEKLHGSRRVLTGLLKEELGFGGVVVSDWEGVDASGLTLKQGLDAGIDMFMFATSWKTSLPGIISLVEAGEVPVARIDDAVSRILRMKVRLGLFSRPMSSASCAASIGSPEHRELARQAVRESLVLLKNDNEILPLDKMSKVVVDGSHADNIPFQSGGWTKKWQGAHADRFGNAARPVLGATSIIQGIRNVIGTDRVIDPAAGGRAAAAEVVIVVVGEEPYAEGFGDRKATELVLDVAQRNLIRQYRLAGKKVVTVLVSGRPLLVTDELADSAAFVAAWLPGSEGQGIADVLFGDYGFVGKLGFSWPRHPDQIPINVGDPGYDPLFPYGFGLSYQRAGKATAMAGAALSQ